MTKRMRTGLLLLGVAPLALACSATCTAGTAAFSAESGWIGQWDDGDRCEQRDERELTGAAVETLRVKSGAGPVEITGEAGLDEVRVSAVLCASDEERLAGLSVTLEGDRLETTYPRMRGGWGNNYARIALTVRVPEGTGIDLEDKSGSAVISDVGAIRVDDGSGSLRVTRVRGDVHVEDGSGSLRIEDVTGNVAVEDGSGSLTIGDVAGSVTLEDGSGGARVRGVTGNVVVTDDGSGGIEIEEVGGEVRVSDAGSGRVRVRDVEGGLTVTGVRRSRIDYENVRGDVDLPPDRRRGRR